MTVQTILKIIILLAECVIFREQLGKILSRLEKVFIFRLAKKYGLIKETQEPIKFYFEGVRTDD